MRGADSLFGGKGVGTLFFAGVDNTGLKPDLTEHACLSVAWEPDVFAGGWNSQHVFQEI
jgi:hypothetical protein